MTAYLIRRLLLVVPTLLAIITLNFFIVQAAPGGPVEQMLATALDVQGTDLDRVSGAASGEVAQSSGDSRAARGLDPEVIAEIERQFGFDKPLWERYVIMLKDYLVFDFGDSLFRARSVIELVIERLPVSLSLGLWSTLLIYAISIPLGIRKAVRHHSRFDVWTSWVVVIGNAIPSFLFAILLIILFAGGSYFNWFPLRGLVSENFDELLWYQKILDYFWHMALPVLALTIGGFASLTMLTKNSFLDEINKQYVMTAKAKGATEKRILYKHVFRNAMLIVIAGFPATFISMFFAGSLLIEVIFSLEGLGLLGFESTLQRDYPVMFGTLYIFGLLGLLIGIISDLAYTWVDPRIDFESR
ncbi:microcin C transport system permease protein [Marinimicrobium koreense]|uniref:Inner membrane ABC transporter permease protein YejB n=1 Tax=Marinimicrobium koreense TaxID=306545 RepID=A0A3N1P4E5_9GAMM|nr:microcin C ABC transporter permease YejB [Marinimicrobium koreense]ROQ21580.1 microcin C transport system permease protein [Marinimicrobium koreense]